MGWAPCTQAHFWLAFAFWSTPDHARTIATVLFPYRWLVPGWSPRHLLPPATGTAPDTKSRGAWHAWTTPFHVHSDEHTYSIVLFRLACAEKRTHQFLPRTRQWPPFPPVRTTAGRTTWAVLVSCPDPFRKGSGHETRAVPPRSLAPDEDVAELAGEIHSGPGTTAVFCSPIDLF